MRRTTGPAVAAGIAFLFASPLALAQNGWEEEMDGDEPPVPVPLDPIGGFPMPPDPGTWDEAEGGLSGANDITIPDDDDFQDAIPIFIEDIASWSITTVSRGNGNDADTMIWLFDEFSNAIMANDNANSSTTFSYLGSDVGPTLSGPGIYWIIVSGSGSVAADAAGNAVFTPGSSTDILLPDSSSTGAIDFWSANGDTGDWKMVFTGIRAVPAPGALSLLIVPALAARRRRR
ncbi:MAG: hypothetical protein AAGB51_04570 [Planctomycetota bacterium]